MEEAAAGGGWCDVLPVVPSILSPADTSELLARCKSVASGNSGGGGGGVQVLAGTCVVSTSMMDGIRQQLLEVARQAADEAHKQRKAGGGGGVTVVVTGGGKAAAVAAAAGGGGKKGAAVAAQSDSDDDDWGGKKGKKGGARGGGKKAGKAAAAGSGGGGGSGKAAAAGKGGGKAGAAAVASGGSGGLSDSALSVAALARRVQRLHPDTEGAGAEGDLPLAIATGEVAGLEVFICRPGCLLAGDERHLLSPPSLPQLQLHLHHLPSPAELRPALVAEYDRVLHAIFTAGAERRRRLRDAASSALDAAHER